MYSPENFYGYSPEYPKVAGRVSLEDYFYIKSNFPFHKGLYDAIISTLYAKFIAECRARIPVIDSPAWTRDHPNIQILSDILAGCTFGISLGSAGEGSSPQHGAGSSGELCETMHVPPHVGSNSESSPPCGEHSPKEGEEKGQRSAGGGVSEGSALDLDALLNLLGKK